MSTYYKFVFIQWLNKFFSYIKYEKCFKIQFSGWPKELDFCINSCKKHGTTLTKSFSIILI